MLAYLFLLTQLFSDAVSKPGMELTIMRPHPVTQKKPPVSSASNQVIYASSFGFSASASPSTNTAALQKISAKINALNGGVTLIINKGVYIVGREKFAGLANKGYAFRGDTLLKISNCDKPIIIEGNQATIKMADGLHFGSFHPTSGRVFNPPQGDFTDYNYAAYPTSVIESRNNKSVTVKNLNLHGNVQKMILGGRWNDAGIQLPADGLLFFDNDEVFVENVTANYFGRDGIMIGNNTPSETAPIKKATIINSVFDGNTRQGFSWIGGNHLYVRNSRFINTGKTINEGTGKEVSSSPSAGVDMEAEWGLIRNGVFENCVINNNNGAGFLTVGNVANIKFSGGSIIGATSYSIYGSGRRFVFENATIVGSGVNLFFTKEENDPDRTHFLNCLLSLSTDLSPTGKVYGNFVMDLGGGGSPVFVNCKLDAAKRGNVYAGNCIFENCTFTQSATEEGYNGYSFMVGGIYKGVNRMTCPGTPDNPNKTNSKFLGPFFINGVDISKQ